MMKKITNILISMIMIGLTSVTLRAQITPQSPNPPQPDVHTRNQSSTTHSSTTTTNDNGKHTSSSISISDTDESYTLKAHFPAGKMQELKDHLMREMGSKNLKTQAGSYEWRVISNNEQIYKIRLSERKLSISVDKEIASPSLVKKFNNIGSEVKSIIGYNNGDHERLQHEAERMQREADRAKREADRMQREANRLQRLAEKDAGRIASEAERLLEKADYMEENARHMGGVSEIIKTLLSQGRTFYNPVNLNNNWLWPNFEKELIKNLLSDGLIDNRDEVNFTKDNSGIFVNGRKINNSRKYNDLFKRHEVVRNHDFSFNKKGQHLVVISGNPQIESFFLALKNKGFISSIRKKVSLEINGNSVIKNGVAVPSSQVAVYNKLLVQHQIIPAPGKIIEIMKAENYKAGYSNDNTHLGTWVFGD